ncbi:flagellar hook-associated protein FlgL [Sphingomonas sp. AOB5]|uniref:flagellar hook-associated protein FlgL n=1 Tax=Sphingomonas sp. AOB5 TaxID=3034017 RepID=UPI0023F868EA|nr:flagellar hook-associated protein FlgL [Sphingomonas sp. AOB5]MDF7777519.1 flagellar hook-associated protein FlgL [Sphingomonas sp. AOB5]
MRIATSQSYDRPATLMASLNSKADLLQTQIATTKKYSAPSDNAAAYVQVQGLNRADANAAAYNDNVKLAQGIITQADGALANVETELQRAQELALQLSNGTLTGTDRAAAASSLTAIIDGLLSIANATDTRGQPVFGGATGDTAFVKNADGSITYAGTGQPSAIPIGDGDSVVPGVTGDRAFGDMFATLVALRDAAVAGDEVPEGTLEGLSSSLDSVTAARASIGARGARLDLVYDRIADTKLSNEEARTAIEGTDISAAITELQKTLTVLQATQASFTKLSSMSLFDYLR